MRLFARIENNKVVEVFDLDAHHPDLQGIDGLFHPSLKWMPAPAGCTEGWGLVNGVLVDKVALGQQALWQAAHDYEYAQISGVAVGLLVLGVLQSKPKALAVQAWSKTIWAAYYTRKATVTSPEDEALMDFSACGNIPHSVPSLMAELGL